MRKNEAKWYVYTLSSSITGAIFYVGCGSGQRMHDHEREARACKDDSDPLKMKVSCIKAIWGAGGCVVKTVIANFWDREGGLALEADLIDHYGKDQLANIQGGIRKTKAVIAARRQEAWDSMGYVESRFFNRLQWELNLWLPENGYPLCPTRDTGKVGMFEQLCFMDGDVRHAVLWKNKMVSMSPETEAILRRRFPTRDSWRSARGPFSKSANSKQSSPDLAEQLRGMRCL